MPYQVLTTVILGLHSLFVAYVVLGGFLAWRWPRAIWPHLLAAAWGLAIVAGRVDCPLTWAEDWSRQRAGEVWHLTVLARSGRGSNAPTWRPSRKSIAIRRSKQGD